MYVAQRPWRPGRRAVCVIMCERPEPELQNLYT
jgi:hypothetical protein